VLLAAGLVYLIVAFAHARWGALAGAVAGGSLCLTPSFFGHSFNNPKDITECFFYTAAVLAGWSALESGRARTWLVAGAAAGVALAQKANALFLPVQLVLLVAGLALYARLRGRAVPRMHARQLGLAALAFVLAYYAVSPAFWSAPIEGPRQWLGQMVEIGNRAVGAGANWKVSFHAPRAVLWHTPLATLALAACGALRPGLAFPLRFFLLLGALLPVARNLLPGTRSFDGTRHFLEFLPMLCLLAGAGAAWLAASLARVARVRAWPSRAAASALVGALALAPSAWAVASTHPNQIVYFNALTGGLGGAQRRNRQDTSDFWANSYWQGMTWLSAHAEPDARLLVPFKDFIARAGAPVRLRPDVRFLDPGRISAEALPLYLMHLVNRGQNAAVAALDAADAPVYAARVQGGAVMHIHRLGADASGAARLARWQQDVGRDLVRKDLRAYLFQHKDKQAAVMEVLSQRLEPAEMVERLRPILPPELIEQLAASLVEDGEADSAPR
jgi:hypothetical protein